MSAATKQAQTLARHLFNLSLAEGTVSAERVQGVLAYVEKTAPANAVLVLKAYHRLVAIELARRVALVEHAGSVDASVLKSIAAAMTQHYGRTITAASKANPGLIAGLRVRVGDDVYEASIAGRLQALANAS